jgi:regulator of sirC expression with transglutaminase-like and TPR domain
LNKALQLDPGHYRAYKNRAKLFAAQGELDQALADFNQSIELEPDFAQNYYDRALVYRDMENPRAAIVDLELFLTLNEDDEWRERAEEKLEEFQGR